MRDVEVCGETHQGETGMSCLHRFGHPSLADDDCLPCERDDGRHGMHCYRERPIDTGYMASVEWDSGHPWDRVVEVTGPTAIVSGTFTLTITWADGTALVLEEETT